MKYADDIRKTTEKLYKGENKMKVVVTGASGYIGRHVVKAFLDQGHKVIACDVDYKGLDERASIVHTDIFSGKESLFDELGRPDLIVHLAWRHGFVHNAQAHMEYLSSHYSFLRNMVLGGCKRIAVMGTMHEIGYWEGPIDEKTPCAPLSLYGVAKNALRQALVLLSKELDFKLYWLRAYYIYGDNLRGNSVFSKLQQAEIDGKQEFPFTSGKNKYDFIHVDALAKQIVAATTQDAITGIINVCSGTPISLGEKMEEFIKENHFKIKLLYGAYPDRPYDSPGVWGDSQKIRQIMGTDFLA